MIRLSVTIWLTLASVILFGCSKAYNVDTTQLRQQRLATGEESPRRIKVSLRSRQRTSTRAVAAPEDLTSTGTVVQTRDLKPWPRRDTPEYDQLQAEEIEREIKSKRGDPKHLPRLLTAA